MGFKLLKLVLSKALGSHDCPAKTSGVAENACCRAAEPKAIYGSDHSSGTLQFWPGPILMQIHFYRMLILQSAIYMCYKGMDSAILSSDVCLNQILYPNPRIPCKPLLGVPGVSSCHCSSSCLGPRVAVVGFDLKAS